MGSGSREASLSAFRLAPTPTPITCGCDAGLPSILFQLTDFLVFILWT